MEEASGAAEESRRFSNGISGKQLGFQRQKEGMTLFIDNLSRRVSRRALWELFSNRGLVRKVYMPMKNMKAKYKETTFAFVTMAEKEDIGRIIRATDKNRVDGFIVKVSLAKFPKPSEEEGSKACRTEKFLMGEGYERRRAGNANYGNQGLKGSRTYRDALLSNPDERTNDNKEDSNNRSQGEKGNKEDNLLNFSIPAKDTE
ncbi:hypothetical protein HRI_004651200 [Hibiscus trionum]|uniref:RRM domain-containing protein n=1 Tax=Hibiscus trionum TaxID=183268 RepID=A0A9W7MSK0_HIBTR|nr:hypothetical protein HRI_004651200 [Hibiscus trionum]